MSGWLVMAALAAASFALLWRFGRMPALGLQLGGAALLLACAGYAWQGSPAQPGAPAAVKPDAMRTDSDFARERERFMGRFGSSAEWLDFADALQRMGEDRLAVTAIKSGLKERPNDLDLWIGLGNALVTHSDGLVTPAAKLAFDRAERIAPGNPATAYFLGLSYAQSGQLDKAAETWRSLLARAPPNAPWRALVEERLEQLAVAMMR